MLHWGDMGTQWGVNRSVAQIHALLYLTDRPLTAEEIAETLGLARSNVSNSLRELLAWRLVHRAPMRGDRRDHFAAETDVWQMVARIVEGRKAREIDPATAALQACIAEAAGDRRVDPVAVQRLNELLQFVQMVDRWYSQMLGLPAAKLMAVMKLGGKVAQFVGGGRKRAA